MNNQLLDAREFKMSIWKEYVLFDWHWWFGVLVTFISIFLWIKFRDRATTANLLLAGFTSSILSALLDTTGNFFGWYDYRYDVIPMTPNYVPWDFFVLPVLVMFTIQFFPKVNVYIKGIILSALISFVGLPILNWMNIYKAMNWNYFYSFGLMYIIFILSYLMSSKVKNQK